MYDPIAAGRRSALSAVAVQVAVVAVLALASLPVGVAQALAVAVGGSALALGNALAARVSLGGIVPARVAFARLVLGAVLKWAVTAGVIAVALAVWHLPPLATVIGLAAGALAYQLALSLRLHPSSRTQRKGR